MIFQGRERSSRSDVESDNVQQLTSRKNMIDRINTSTGMFDFFSYVAYI